MSWFRRPAPLPQIPQYAPPPEIETRTRPGAEPGMVVEETSLNDVGIDVEALSNTGLHRAWDRFAAQANDGQHGKMPKI